MVNANEIDEFLGKYNRRKFENRYYMDRVEDYEEFKNEVLSLVGRIGEKVGLKIYHVAEHKSGKYEMAHTPVLVKGEVYSVDRWLMFSLRYGDFLGERLSLSSLDIQLTISDKGHVVHDVKKVSNFHDLEKELSKLVKYGEEY